MSNIELKKDELTGKYFINNYLEVKQKLEQALEKYREKTYTDPDEAAKDKEVLEGYKESLQSIISRIKEPYAEVEKQIDGLLKLIQKPLSVINSYEKQLREEERRKELMAIAEECADVLGEYYSVIAKSS